MAVKNLWHTKQYNDTIYFFMKIDTYHNLYLILKYILQYMIQYAILRYNNTYIFNYFLWFFRKIILFKKTILLLSNVTLKVESIYFYKEYQKIFVWMIWMLTIKMIVISE